MSKLPDIDIDFGNRDKALEIPPCSGVHDGAWGPLKSIIQEFTIQRFR